MVTSSRFSNSPAHDLLQFTLAFVVDAHFSKSDHFNHRRRHCRSHKHYNDHYYDNDIENIDIIIINAEVVTIRENRNNSYFPCRTM